MAKPIKLGVLGLLSLFLATALIATGCGDDDDEAAPAGEIETIQSGRLTVGSDIPFPPFEFGRAPNYQGFDIDLSREIARRLNLRLRVLDTPFDTIFRDLAQRKFDMVASATTITPERERSVDFSDPYYRADQALLVERDSDIRTVADLAGKRVGAQDGTTGADYAKDETDAARVRTYAEYDDAFNAVAAGQIDAVIADLPAAQDAVERKEGLEVVRTIETGEEYGFAFGERSDALRRRVNRALADIKEDGTYERLYRRYFEEDPPAEILDATHRPS